MQIDATACESFYSKMVAVKILLEIQRCELRASFPGGKEVTRGCVCAALKKFKMNPFFKFRDARVGLFVVFHNF